MPSACPWMGGFAQQGAEGMYQVVHSGSGWLCSGVLALR